MTTKTYSSIDELPDLVGGKQLSSVDELPDLKKKGSSPISSIPSLSASATVGDGVAVGTETTPSFQSEFQLGVSAVRPTIKKQSDKERYAAIENADANTLISQYDTKISEQTTDIIENPFDFGKRKVDFEQSREGKVGKILKDFQEAKASASDLNYVAKVAPKAAKEIIRSVLPTVPEENLLAGEVIDAAIREGGKINIQRVKDKKISDNRNVDAYIVNQLSSLPDVTIDPSKIVDAQYSEQLVKDISAKQKEELDILNNEFPEKAVTYENNRGVTRTEMVRPPEYNGRLSEIQKKYGELRNMVGLKAAYENAKKDPTADPLSLGENWAKIALPDEYKTWQESNKASTRLSRDMAQVGVNSLYGSENAGAVELAFLDERNLNNKYPEAKAAEVRHRLGAELNKGANWVLNAAPSVGELDEAAKQLTQEDRDFYYKHVREEERRMIGTNIPQRGVLNELGKGGGQALTGIVKYLDRKVGDRTSADVATDALNAPFDTGFQKVGDFAPAVHRLKQINDKQKGGADLSKEEIKEKEDLESFTNVRSGFEKVVDGSFNLGGQVLVQALLTRGVGGIATKGVQGLGLLRGTNVAQGLTGLESVAANATNFGIVTAPTIEKIVGGAIAYASSYDQAEQDAMRLMPGEENAGKRTVFANTVGVLNAVTENIFRDSKVLDAFNREISPNVRVLVNKLTAGEISQEALAPALTKLLKQSATFAKYATVENSKEAFEETAVSAGTSAAIAILAPAKFNFNDAFNEAVGTFTSTFSDGGLVAGFAAVNPTRAANIGIRTMASLGVNKQLTDDANSFIDAQLANGQMTHDVANEKKQIINTASRINTMVMPEVNQLGTLSERSSAKYSVQLLNEKILSGKADETKDEVLKAKYQEQIKQSEGVRKQLLDNDVFVGSDFSIKTPEEINAEQRAAEPIETEGIVELTPEENKAAEGLAAKDFEGTGLKIYADVLKDENSTPAQKKEALQGISDQLTAKSTEAQVGEILGKDADLIYDLKYPAPTESAALENIESDARIKERSAIVTPVLERINNADYINEAELDTAADQLYDALDEVESDDTFTPEQKDNARNLIEPIISKIEGYEFRTKTETRKVAETKATQVAKPTRQRKTKPPLERVEEKQVSFTNESGEINGVLSVDNGNYIISDNEGNKIAEVGEKKATNVPDLPLATEEDTANPIEFDENGAVKSVTLKTRNGSLLKITDPDIALDIAIQERANQIGEITPEEFDTVYETIEKEVQEEVLVNQQTNKNEVQQPATPAQPIAVNEPANATNATTGQTRNKIATPAKSIQNTKERPTVKSLTEELRALLGNEAAALTGDANPKSRKSFKDIGIEKGEKLSSFIDKLIDSNGIFTSIFKAAKADPNFKNIQLELVDRLENGESALYHPVGYGEGKDMLLQIADKDNVEYTAAHELMHFLTLDSDTANKIKDTSSYQAVTDMYNFIADKKGKPVAIAGGATIESYGLTNEKEFMAELLINPTFRKYVSDVFAENKDDIFKASKSVRDSKVNSIGDIIFNLFRDLFNKIFSSKQSDIPFDEKQSVVDNAARLATQLFFGGENVIVGQTDSGQGATVLGMGSQDQRTAALALPGTNRDEVINSFVKSALDRGESETDIKAALVNNGISESDAQRFIDSNKPTPKETKQKTSKSDNEIISTVLNQRIDARTFPTIFQDNETGQQIAAGTQGAGQGREVDGAYVQALEENLRDISIQGANLLRNELGADWGNKTLAWIEQNPSQGNIAQVIGLLNIISTENYQVIQDTHDGNRVRKLSAIQRRIDVVAMQRARDASLALRQRILYAKFAQGGNMADVIAQSRLSPELQQLQADMNEVLSEQVTDEEINSAPPLKTTKPKKQSPIRKAMGAAKRKSNPAVKDELISKGAEAANKTKKTFKELIEDAKNKLKNTKC